MRYGKTHRMKLDQERYWRKIAAHLCCEYEVQERLPRAEALFRTPNFLCAWPQYVTEAERRALPDPNDPCVRAPYCILLVEGRRQTYRWRDLVYAGDSLLVVWKEWERVWD